MFTFKFVSNTSDAFNISEGWFTIDEKPPIAYVKVEILEGADMKPSDLNGGLYFVCLHHVIQRHVSCKCRKWSSIIDLGYYAGLADPYVKGKLGPYRFQTKIQRKTLAPKWHEEFRVPISSWEAPNLLVLQVRDKDHIFDDLLGFVPHSYLNIHRDRDPRVQNHDLEE